MRQLTDEAGTKGIEAVFCIAAPADFVLELLWEPANYPALFPDVKEHSVLARDSTTMEVAFRVDAVIKTIRYVLHRTLDREARQVRWRELSGDLRRIRGGWTVEPIDAPTMCRVTYRTFVDIGRFVPSRALAIGAKRKAGEMTERVRRVAAELASAGRAP